jgi:hypothetical protein
MRPEESTTFGLETQPPPDVCRLSMLYSRMLKRSLAKTNPYLSDPAKRRAMFQMTVCTSTDVEGVKLTSSDLGSGTRTARKATSRESAKSSRSRR